MEAERVAMNPDEISAWFNRLRPLVDGIPRRFVFSIDEAECSNHTDSREV
jgi:hypothetical protein